MNEIIILTKNHELGKSFERYFHYVKGLKPNFIPLVKAEPKQDWICSAFRQIANEIEKLENGCLKNIIVIFDFCDDYWEGVSFNELNPIQKDGRTWAAVVAMLILAFPEIHWIFITPYKPIEKYLFKEAHIYSLENLLTENLKIHEEGFIPLFDATSLRDTLKNNAEVGNKFSPKMRKEIAAAIDEEKAYAFFNAYTAYKFKNRCIIVNTEAMMRRVFKEESRCFKFKFTFEDIYLNFPDRSIEESLSDLEKRDTIFPGLKNNIENRVFISVAHERGGKRQLWDQNISYLNDLKKKGIIKNYALLKKPFSGIYELWREVSSLESENKEKDIRKYRHINLFEIIGKLNKFLIKLIPDKKSHIEKEIEEGKSHSSPGRLLEIAERLIERAEKILKNARSVEDCIYGAVLALEAQEILGYRTPTTCLEAIALKHQNEVKAECMFYGVGYNFDMENRIKEIEEEVNKASLWFDPKMKKRCSYNAQLAILTEIVEILRDFGQFDEEQECLKKVREIYRNWYFLNNPCLKFFKAFRAYIENLLATFYNFIFAIFGWPALFGIISKVIKANFSYGEKTLNSIWEYILNSYFTFFGLQPSAYPENGQACIISMILIVFGFFHLGIFIAYLYTLIYRK